MNIYVGNLPYRVTEMDLRKSFCRFGELRTVTIIKDGSTGKSQGFGYVEMDNRHKGAEAISNLNNKDFMGRKLMLKEMPSQSRFTSR